MFARKIIAMALVTMTVGLLAPGSAAATDLPAHGLALHHVVYGDYSGLPTQNNPQFGFSVAMDDNWLAVGAPYTVVDLGSTYGQAKHGAVFLFLYQYGEWVLIQRILTGGYGDSHCGWSVAVDDNLLVIGCPGADNVSPSTGAGQVRWYELLFHPNGQPFWAEDYGWNGVTGGACGADVDALADRGANDIATIVYGCPNSNSVQGRVDLWNNHGQGTGWTRDAILTASDASSYDNFGNSVSLYEDDDIPFGTELLAVGAPSWGGSDGKAYLFSGFLGWSEIDSMLPYDPANNDDTYFGSAVALLDQMLLVGVPSGVTFPCINFPRCGTVQRFAGSNWNYVSPSAVVGTSDNAGGNPSGPQLGMHYGASIAIGLIDTGSRPERVVAIGAPDTNGYNYGGGLAQSAGYVDLRLATTMSFRYGELRPYIVGPLSPQNDRQFGASVDFGSENRLAVGSPGSGIRGSGAVGGVFIYGPDRIFQDGFEFIF